MISGPLLVIWVYFLPGHPEGLPTMRRSGREGHWKMNGCKTGEAMSTGSSGSYGYIGDEKISQSYGDEFTNH